MNTSDLAPLACAPSPLPAPAATARRAQATLPASWAALAAALALAVAAVGCSCSEDPKPKPTPDTAEQDSDDVAGDADPDTGVASDADAAEDVAVDAGGDAGDSGGVPDGEDTADTVSTSCSSDTYCKTALAGTLKACEDAICKDGTCVAIQKGGACCGDADCDDGNTCTLDKCDVTAAKCENKPKPNCCAGQLTLLDVGFEQSSFEEFAAVEGSSNGNVKWSLSADRSHTGKSALYLGNPCKTYDSSMTVDNGCKPGAAPGTILSKLSSKEVILPAGKQALAHFWVWIAAEPMFALGSRAGNCPKGCPVGSSCIKLSQAAGDVCLPENDVLKVYVDVAGTAAGSPVWVSTEVNKTTTGWHHVSVNLAPFQKAGAETAVKLRWEFSANNIVNEFEGVYVDDVVIETLCAGEGSLCDKATACKDDGNPCTADSCTLFANDKAAGLCFYNQTPGCCVAVSDCNDKNDCTVDVCTKEASATQGSCENPPDSSNPVCCQEKDLYSDGFEAGTISSWQISNSNSKTVLWQVNGKEGKSGKSSLYFGNAAFSGYDDPVLGNAKGPRATICSKAIKLQQGTVYNVATFQLKLQTEWSGQPAGSYKNPPAQLGFKLDEFRVEVALPTGLKPVWSSDAIFGTSEGAWVPVIVALDAWAGQEVRLCFSFDAGDGLGNTQGGVWIDDFALKVSCTKQKCLADGQCAAECGACSDAQCVSGGCKCTKKEGCCLSNADCDDGDKCSADSCKDGVCSNVIADPQCCTDKVGDKGLVFQGFEDGKLPTGWKTSKLSGQAPFGGALYDQTIQWNVNALKAKTGTYALCFADATSGLYNAGSNVPAGKVTTPVFVPPTAGTALVNFDLFLSTEWDQFPFKEFPFAVDQLVVHAVDTEEVDPAKARTLLWDSYAIAGTTGKAWRNVVAEIPAALVGKKIKLEFYFDAGNANHNVFQGACIDNLEVAVLCTKPACVTDEACKPSSPDPCKSYVCVKTEKSFACDTGFKGGEGCCQPSVALTVENGEAGSLAKWTGLSSSDTVKWQIISHKYLVGNKEVYFGAVPAFHYAAGSGQACTLDTDCPAGEKCSGAPSSKICGVPVNGTLTSDPITLATDKGKGAQLRFKMYLDIEMAFEKFQLEVLDLSGKELGIVWTHTKVTDMAPGEYKSVVDRTVDLSAFQNGEAIRLRFRFDSVDSSKNDKFQGIFLDDLIVEQPCKL